LSLCFTGHSVERDRYEVIVVRAPTPNRPWVSMVVATGGYGITYFAWALTAPIGFGPHVWPGLGAQTPAVLLGAAVLVWSLASVPVGVLTDRYGGRVVLPTLCALLAVPVMGLAAVDAGPWLIAAVCAIGVAGTTLAAGAAVVVRATPRAWRGQALTVFAAGQGMAVVAGLMARPVFPVDRVRAAPLLALALVLYAVVAAALLRDRPSRQTPTGWQAVLDVARTPAARQLSSWYAVSFGGTLAVFLFLPSYLDQAYGVDLRTAALHTAACLLINGLSRPIGGWLCQHREPRFLLSVSFLGTGTLVLVLAFQPPLPAVLALVHVVSALLGVAIGVVLALVGATAPPARAGTVAGVVSTIGGLVGLIPPLLLAAAHDVSGSYGAGLALLAGATLTGAAYLRLKGRWIGTALAFPASISPGNAETVLVAVSSPPNGNQVAQTMAALTSMANQQEMVVVSGGGDRAIGYELVVGLRTHLPRHRIVGLAAGPIPHHHETAMLAELLAEGALPVVLTGPARPEGVALLLAEALGTHRVLMMTRDRVDGVMLRPPWAPVASVPIDC
jgi:NNP family nitrate/nitrite transporter-like MFS transporter